MTDKEVDELIKANKKLQDFERKHKIEGSISHLTEAELDQWLKLTAKTI